ncbi:hypothetical protein BMS3Abin11_02490 [bacterium BMS3Abin11]|nr:hypothetical protein BMS3Abin11_02490 [bacterium BMS3Abin11]
MIQENKIDALTSLCPDVALIKDAGIDYISLPKLTFKSENTVRTMDALLCPVRHSGYATRLFLSEKIPGRGCNWTVHSILGRTWHTWSWNNVPDTLSPAQILSAHIRALQ